MNKASAIIMISVSVVGDRWKWKWNNDCIFHKQIKTNFHSNLNGCERVFIAFVSFQMLFIFTLYHVFRFDIAFNSHLFSSHSNPRLVCFCELGKWWNSFKSDTIINWTILIESGLFTESTTSDNKLYSRTYITLLVSSFVPQWNLRRWKRKLNRDA